MIVCLILELPNTVDCHYAATCIDRTFSHLHEWYGPPRADKFDSSLHSEGIDGAPRFTADGKSFIMPSARQGVFQGEDPHSWNSLSIWMSRLVSRDKTKQDTP